MIAFKTIMRKEILRFSRIWVQTIFPPIITTSLYLIIFGGLIGSMVGTMAGYSYLDYIIPGVIIMTVITNSYGNTVASFFLAKFNHSVEELLVSPMPNAIILLGYISGGVMRGVVVGILVYLTTVFFTNIAFHNIATVLIILVLTAILFSIAGFINAIFARDFDDISIIPTFVLMPMTYLGGMFYDISILPEFWQTVSFFNPIYYMVDAFRFGFLGVSNTDVLLSISTLLIMIALLFWWAVHLMNKGITNNA